MHYILIDTSGLFVYIKKRNYSYVLLHQRFYKHVAEGFFSNDACGKIYSLEFSVLKKKFKQNPQFIQAIKKEHTNNLIKPAKNQSTTVLNELYNKFVRH